MNALKYIKDHGVDKAREVLSGAPAICAYFEEYPLGVRYYRSNIGCNRAINLSDVKRLVESVEIISKFDSVQEAKDAIANAPEGATEFRRLSCSTRYIKVGPRFFEYWDGFNWCRPTVPFTDETHILRFAQLSRLEQAITDYELIYEVK